MNTGVLMAGVGLLLGLLLLSSWHQYQMYKQTRQLQDLVTYQAKRADTAEAFGYLIAHDLRAPLLQIRYRTEQLKDALHAEHNVLLSRVLDVEQIVDSTNTMIKQMLQLHRLDEESLVMSEFEMEQLVQSTYESLKETANFLGGISVAPMPSVRADRVLMHQVWQNLILNGMKFSSEAPSPLLHVSYESRGNFHLFWLADNGKGLPPDTQLGVFEPLEQLLRVKGEGYGLGLTIVKRIVEKHGGEVWAQALPTGARFGFSLPTMRPAK